MSYITRAGFRLLFWLAKVLVDSGLNDEQRADLRAIATSFSNDSMPKPER